MVSLKLPVIWLNGKSMVTVDTNISKEQGKIMKKILLILILIILFCGCGESSNGDDRPKINYDLLKLKAIVLNDKKFEFEHFKSISFPRVPDIF